jgi:hypothetical protein
VCVGVNANGRKVIHFAEFIRIFLYERWVKFVGQKFHPSYEYLVWIDMPKLCIVASFFGSLFDGRCRALDAHTTHSAMRFLADEETPNLTLEARTARPSMRQSTSRSGVRTPSLQQQQEEGIGLGDEGTTAGSGVFARGRSRGGGSFASPAELATYRAPSAARPTTTGSLSVSGVGVAAPAAAIRSRAQSQLIAGYYSLEPEGEDERQLVEQLKDRVRELNVELEESDVRRQQAWLQAEDSVRMVRHEAGIKVEKYRGERDKLQERLEELRRKFGELDKDDYDQIKDRLEKLEVVSRDGWEQAAVKNIKLQKLREKLESLQSRVGAERSAKEAAQQIRDKALARLKPFKEKNLQMEHRLSLQHNLYTSAAHEARQTGNELIRLQKSYAELSERAKRAVEAGNDAGDEFSKTQVELDHLTEDFESLQATSRLALGAREDLERQVFEQSNENTQLFDENEDLKFQLEEATRQNDALEANLAAKQDELEYTRDEFSGCMMALENESEARQTLEARAGSLEQELAVLREVLHAPMLSGSNVHITLKQRFGSIKTLVHHAFDSPAAVSEMNARPATSSGALPHPGKSNSVTAPLRPGTFGGGTSRGR